MDKLRGTSYIPNPLRSPALMVLASTAEAARTSTSPGPMSEYHSIYSSSSGRYLDSETVHRMAFSSSPYQHRPQFALYHGQPGEHYSDRVQQEYSSHFLQLHPHLAGSLLHAKNGGPGASFHGTGAFRRVGPAHDHSFPFHPLQHQRGLLERDQHLEENRFANTVSDSEGSTDRLSKERVSPHSPDGVFEECPNGEQGDDCSPQSAASYDYENTGARVKEVNTAVVKMEQVEDGKCEEKINDQETVLEKRRRQLSPGQLPCCPICGTSIRPGEMESHFAWEMERMRMNEDNKKGRRSQREAAAQARKNVQTQTGIGKRMKHENNRLNVPNDDTPASTRHQTYLRVCANRMNRNGRSAINKSVRSRSSQSSPVSCTPLSSIDGDQGPSVVKATVCPVCEEPIRGNHEELNVHVETCLRKRNGCSLGADDDDDDGGDDGGQVFLEYEWAGQTRIRASSLLEGGYAGSGFQTARKRKKDDDEDDADLDIDGDDSKEYGKPQYSEADIIPCSSDEPGEEQARQALRGAVLSGENSPVLRSTPTRSRWSDEEEDKGQGGKTGETSKKEKHGKSDSQPDCSDPSLVIRSLKSRLKEMEQHKRTEKIKCLICMEPYTVPLVSIGCWHVHCEECWMRTLGAKKLCPQCNMITSPSELRRIFL